MRQGKIWKFLLILLVVAIFSGVGFIFVRRFMVKRWPHPPFFVVANVESLTLPEDSTDLLTGMLERALKATLDSAVEVTPFFYGRVAGRDEIARIIEKRRPLLVWWLWVEPESTKAMAFRGPGVVPDTVLFPDTLVFVRHGEFDALSTANLVAGVSYLLDFLHEGDTTALSSALPLLENAAVDFDDANSWLLLGWCYLGNGEYRLARQAFYRADTSRLEASYGLGLAYLLDNHSDSALVAFQQAIAHAPTDMPLPIIGYAEALIKLEMPDEGIKALRASLKEMQNYPRGNFLMGLAFQMKSQYDSAIFYYRRAVKLDSSWTTPLYNLAVAYSKAGDTLAAIRNYERVLKIDSLAFDAMQNIAWLYLDTGETDSAIYWFEKILSRDSLSTDALFGLASSFQASNSIEKADSALLKCIAISPEYLPAYLKRVQIFLEAGKIDKAFDAAREAVDSLPDDALVYNALGAVYIASGDYRSAVRVLEQALELNPSEIDVISNLGLAYQMMGKLDNSLKYYRKVSEFGADAAVLSNIAAIYIEKHQPEKALETLKRAESITPQDARIQYLKGVAYYLAGNIGMSKLSFVKCKSLTDDVQLNTMADRHIDNLSQYGTL